jgi:hypothetical protein
MRTLIVAAPFALGVSLIAGAVTHHQVVASRSDPQTRLQPNYRLAGGIMCMLRGQEVSGMNKICYYDCAGSAAAITVASYQLCPLSINR